MIRIIVVILSLIVFILLPACTKHDQTQGYRLLIYYGTPLGVNDVWDEEKAVKVFANYDYIILGDGLNNPTYVHYPSTRSIMKKVRDEHPDVMFFGYVNADMLEDRLPLDEVAKRIENWQNMGVDGIFLDCMGYDYKVTRQRQNAIIDEVHKRGMPVFVNAWNPDDVMGNDYDPEFNPHQLATKMRKGDLYLLEKFLLPYDVEDEKSPSLFAEEFAEKMEKALRYRITLGVKLLSVSRIDYNNISDDALMKFFKMNEAAAAVFSLDGYGVSPVEYSSSVADKDVVILFPYMTDYMEYYDVKAKIRYDENLQQFSRGEFIVRSRMGDHEYKLPKNKAQ